MSSIHRVGLAAAMDAQAHAHGDLVIGLAGAGEMGTDMVVESL